MGEPAHDVRRHPDGTRPLSDSYRTFPDPDPGVTSDCLRDRNKSELVEKFLGERFVSG